MIKITINQRELRITANGHAGYAEKGKDIVCAGVSSLVMTWGSCVDTFRDAGWLEDCVISVGDGSADIYAKPKEHMRKRIEVSFLTIVEGLMMIWKGCREYVELSIVTD